MPATDNPGIPASGNCGKAWRRVPRPAARLGRQGFAIFHSPQLLGVRNPKTLASHSYWSPGIAQTRPPANVRRRDLGISHPRQLSSGSFLGFLAPLRPKESILDPTPVNSFVEKPRSPKNRQNARGLSRQGSRHFSPFRFSDLFAKKMGSCPIFFAGFLHCFQRWEAGCAGIIPRSKRPLDHLRADRKT